MLVLTRDIGEKIMIGDDIEITVQAVKGRQARFSISAPTKTGIYREEIYLREKKHKLGGVE